MLLVMLVGISSNAQSPGPSPDAISLFYRALGDRGSGKPVGSQLPQPLGIRYNILQLSPIHKSPIPVDPEGIFRTGDRIVLDLEASKPGFLYVLALNASGKWSSLYPTDPESNRKPVLPLAKPTRAPEDGSFIEFTEPSGTERLFVILLQDQSDVKELLTLYRMSSLSPPADPASDHRGEAIAKIQSRFASRDLVVKRIASPDPERSNERPYAVYAVAPASRLFIEIKLRHE
jgi:hypothetical protein